MATVKYRYISFLLETEGKKTNVYNCCSNRNMAKLGIVKWYGAWRQYCFFPEGETVFNTGCLEDVNCFIETLMIERKEKKSTKGKNEN